MQWEKRPCRQPDDISQSVDASAIINKIITMLPHMKAITWKMENECEFCFVNWCWNLIHIWKLSLVYWIWAEKLLFVFNNGLWAYMTLICFVLAFPDVRKWFDKYEFLMTIKRVDALIYKLWRSYKLMYFRLIYLKTTKKFVKLKRNADVARAVKCRIRMSWMTNAEHCDLIDWYWYSLARTCTNGLSLQCNSWGTIHRKKKIFHSYDCWGM